MIDTGILFIPSAAVIFASAALTVMRPDAAPFGVRDGVPVSDMRVLAIPVLMPTLVWLAYVVVGNGRGATPGKRRVGLRVMDAAGAAPGMRRALARAAIPLGVNVLVFAPFLSREFTQAALTSDWTTGVSQLASLVAVVDVLWMTWDPRKQTLHDKLAGTFVVVG